MPVAPELLQSIFSNMAAGICVVRARDGVIVHATPRFTRILGYADGELDGTPVEHINARIAGDPRETAERLATLIRERGQATYEVANVRKDGTVIVCRATTSVAELPQHGTVFVAVQEDVTERKREDVEREGFFRLSLDLLCTAGFDGRFKRLNPAWTETLGWSLEELTARAWIDFVHPDDVAGTVAETDSLRQGSLTRSFKNRYRCKDGSYRTLEWHAAPAAEFQLIYATARDVTEQELREEALRRRKAEVRASLQEKEVLLKEIHHRVKNNLQVISSLLKLHAVQIESVEARTSFEQAQQRVRSIAMLHESLYRSKDLGRVDMAEYTRSIVRSILLGQADREVAVTVEADDICLDADRAVPCGLILNELVTNVFKHAFVDGSSAPAVRVALRRAGRDLVLSVTDNGRGFPDAGPAPSRGLGLELVRTLGGQLGAEVALGAALPGTTCTVRFPDPEPPRSDA
jgi:PAS domain S-box-containing protein